MEINFTSRHNFGEIKHKKPGKLSVGFEWEIPMHESLVDEYEDYEWEEYYGSSRRWITEGYGLKPEGFRYHLECGGVEFAFPITNHMNHTKALIRKAKEIAYSNPDVLDPEYTGLASDCGIHVHVPANEEVFKNALGMLNRKSSKEFVWEISGRERGKGYSRQAQATCWDADKDCEPYQNIEMLRYQSGFGTLEFRLFGPHPDVLERAVEFSHSVVKFLASRRDKERIPYLSEWKEWVLKQKGYSVLKREAKWGLIKNA